jgi:DNA modification methylase
MRTIKQYEKYLQHKNVKPKPIGFTVNKSDINKNAKPFQVALAIWNIWLGRAATFADTGLGKTILQLEIMRIICEKTGGKALIFAPLTVVDQTANDEALKFRYSPGQVNICASQEDVKPGINITNYQKLHKFDMSQFVAVGLDEASIIKSFAGFYRNELIKKCQCVKYRFVFTATPDPNDRTELANYAEFLGTGKRKEILADYFINDQDTTQKWRLKQNGESNFWKWISTWAAFVKLPSDIGFSDDGYVLPEHEIINHVVETPGGPPPGFLYKPKAETLNERRAVRRETIPMKVAKVKEIIDSCPRDTHHLVFCGLNDEGVALQKAIDGAVEVAGRHKDEQKNDRIHGFAKGKYKTLVTKTEIAGMGLNFQEKCHSVIFCGLSDSWEAFKQGYSRVLRFGQKEKVTIHTITADTEGNVLENIERKGRDAENKQRIIIQHTKGYVTDNINIREVPKKIKPEKIEHYRSDRFEAYKGNCYRIMHAMKDNSIDYICTSTPFAELFAYSDKLEDLGNCKSYEMFFEDFDWYIEQMVRVIKPGRLISLHCITIPAMKERDGYIGLKDFPGDLVRAFEKYGMIYHSNTVIWKDPLIEATRTHSLGLQYSSIMADSARARSGIPDIIITMRAPGENKEPILHPKGLAEFDYFGTKPPKTLDVLEYEHQVWQRYASPVWDDIKVTDTLNVREARDEKDTKHICPFSLQTVGRLILLYSNPGDKILDNFAGIFTTPYQAVAMGRYGIGMELKDSFYNAGLGNMKHVKMLKTQKNLFDELKN